MRALILVALSALVIVLAPSRAPLMAATATSPAATTAPTGASFIQQFTTDYDTLLVIPDPLPNLQRLLTSRRLQELWDTGKLTSFIRRTEPGTTLPSLQAAWMIVLQNHRWVPDEIAVGLPRQAWEDLDHFMRGLVLVNLALNAEGAEDAAGRKKLNAQLLAEMQQLRLPPVRVWVRFRDEQDATSLLQLATEQLQELAAGAPVKVTAEPNALRVGMAVIDALPDVDARIGALEEVGLISGKDDPDAHAMADAFGKLRLDAALERSGAGLRLTLGQSRDGAAPLTAADLGPVYSADDRTILFARWDVGRAIAAAQGWSKLWDEWKDTPLGKATAEADTEDFTGDLRVIARQLQDTPPVGGSRVWGTETGVDLRVLEQGAKPAPPLAPSALVRLIPADAEAFGLDNTATLGEAIVGSFTDMESRLVSEELKETVGGKRPRRDFSAEQLSAAYYQHFAALRQFVLHEGADWFAPGGGAIIGSRGTLRKLDVHSTSQPSDRLALENLPIPELAILGVPKTPEQGLQYAERFYAALVDGILGVVREQVPDAPATKEASGRVTKADLGLGVDTYAFDAAWLQALASEVSITIDGDLRPHFFLHDGAMVFSTSPRLSKQMIDAAKSGKSLKLPAAGGGGGAEDGAAAGEVVAHGSMSGKLLETLVNDMAKWVAAIAAQERGGVAATQPADGAGATTRTSEQDVTELFAGIAEYLGLVDTMQYTSRQQGDRRTTSGSVTFGK